MYERIMMDIISRAKSGELVTVNKLIFSAVINFLTPKNKSGKIPFWLVVFVFIGLISALGYFVSVKVEHIHFERNVIVPYFISAFYIAVLILLCEKILEVLITKLELEIIPSIKSPKDLESLDNRLSIMFLSKNQVYFALYFSLGVHLLFIAPNLELTRVYGWGIIIGNIVLNFFHGVCVYFVYSYVFWTFSELREYDFSLFWLDPSSSEIISILSRMFNGVLYSVIVMIAVITIVLARFDIFARESVFITIGIMWVTASTIFTFNQLILARIIQKGKWRTLNEIQSKIAELQIKENIPSQETFEHIDKLIALHNSVKSTPNSTLNFRSFLEFLNSLFLPTIGIVVGSIKNITELLGKFFP